jgi:hypothetical protein
MNKAAIIISSLILLTQSNLFGQQANAKTDPIDFYTYQLDTTISKADSISFLLDSIHVKAYVQKNKIIATCLFEKSKSLLTIYLYSKDNNLVAAKVQEQCPTMDDLHNYASFYYDKGKLLDNKYRWTVRPCMAVPMDKSIYELYGYNPNLNGDFLKKFVVLVYEKLKP